MWVLERMMGKKTASRKPIAGQNASANSSGSGSPMHQDDEQRYADASPAKKRSKGNSKSDEDDYATSEEIELDDDELRLAKFISAQVIKQMTPIIATSVEKSVRDALAEAKVAREIAEEALETANAANAGQKQTAGELVTLRAEVAEQGKQIAALKAKMPNGSVPRSAANTNEPSEFFGITMKEASDKFSASVRISQLKLNFINILDEANESRTFVLGRKDDRLVTRAAAQALMSSFFPEVKCVVSKGEKDPNARVFVPVSEDAKMVATAAKNLWVEFASQGWWFAVDRPEDLRKLESRARGFLAEAKKVSEKYKKTIGFVSVTNGLLLKQGRELLPIFLIPAQSTGTWKHLFPLLVKRIESLQGGELLSNYGLSDGVAFHTEWCELAGLSTLAEDVRTLSKAQPGISPLMFNDPDNMNLYG